uniref:Uncharacterized protein n=1 Tax=Grammatophora oceanica TaxID=210454 RepID=A0A7S1VAZ5_9STRA|eukprot:CAMPEP_0194049780 /NCGR_PEP_ID=MMETSP0009_2-20130614/30923_1 /TAXON_ID=210454 /ORGANISM="Grammatophora oceanica, Strain CCMP 410" /LENGTH=393 /DNA_ID=CAMNT_0038696003 /DNA_START=82 /DNA_END=1263 /DNA_ORIENTATION=-
MLSEDCQAISKSSEHSSSSRRSRASAMRRYGSKSDDENDPDHPAKGRRRSFMRKEGSKRWYGSKSDDENDLCDRLASSERPQRRSFLSSLYGADDDPLGAASNHERRRRVPATRSGSDNSGIDLSRSGNNIDSSEGSRNRESGRQLYSSSTKSSRESSSELKKAAQTDELDHSSKQGKLTRRNSLKSKVMDFKLALAKSETEKADLQCQLAAAHDEAAAQVDQLQKEKEEIAKDSEKKICHLEDENAKLKRRLKAMEKRFISMQTTKQRKEPAEVNALCAPMTPRVSNRRSDRVPDMEEEGAVSEHSSNTSSTEDEGDEHSDPLFDFSESIAAAEQDEASIITKVFASTSATVVTQSSSSSEKTRKGRKRSKTPRRRSAKSPRRQRASSSKAT